MKNKSHTREDQSGRRLQNNASGTEALDDESLDCIPKLYGPHTTIHRSVRTSISCSLVTFASVYCMDVFTIPS